MEGYISHIRKNTKILRISASVDSRARGTITCQLVKKLSHVLYLNLTLNDAIVILLNSRSCIF